MPGATRFAVCLTEPQVAEIRAVVASGQAADVSAFVEHAVKIALADAAGWQEMLDGALEETGGPLTEKEIEWADSILKPRQGKSLRRKSGALPRQAGTQTV